MTSSTISEPTTLYLAYGSNLSLSQMHHRCPTSTPVGLARLPSYNFQINTRGYANIISSSPSNISEVWGLLYALTPSDISHLDVNEGVPWAYTKEFLEVDFWASTNANGNDGFLREKIDTDTAPVKKEVLVYIDRNRTEEGDPREEYIHRMNRGINDVLKVGIPSLYVEKVMRTYIPTMEEHEKSKQQAGEFDMKMEEL